MSGTGVGCPPTRLRARHALSGTDLGYAAMQAQKDFILFFRGKGQWQVLSYAIGLRVCYAISGTDLHGLRQRHTPRNQAQENTNSVQLVPGMRCLGI